MSPCFSRLRQLKRQAAASINATEEIKKCLLCKDRLKQIEEHHKNETKLLQGTKNVAKCQQCRPIITAIIDCAKHGHIHEETPMNDDDYGVKPLEESI